MRSTKSRLWKMGTAGTRKYVAAATENISIHQDDNAQNCIHTRVKELWRKISWGHEGKKNAQTLVTSRTQVLLRFQVWFSCPLHSLFLSSLKHWVFARLLCAHRRQKTETPWPLAPRRDGTRVTPKGYWKRMKQKGEVQTRAEEVHCLKQTFGVFTGSSD